MMLKRGEAMSIEAFLLLNLAADLALLGATAKALGIFRWRRVLACGIICAGYGILATTRPVPWATMSVQLALLAGVSGLIAQGCGPWLWLKALALTAGGALLAGGVAQIPCFAAKGPEGILCALLGAALLMLMLSVRQPLRGDWQVTLSLETGVGRVRFPALIDTGNRLREPLSGLPVVIAEARLLEGALPGSGWRQLPFGAVGGSGRMACFRPAALWIERGRHRSRAPEVWIALYPGPLPGSASALAPSEFASFV